MPVHAIYRIADDIAARISIGVVRRRPSSFSDHTAIDGLQESSGGIASVGTENALLAIL
ncbi:hypothetical protein ACQP1G_38650 [Nocardia sp. CA-107356]|uniref:hypothetical protein n=1 Tax=Nocardia sp. CA-107356 TaxID=3239972 RepID=UPI003D8FF3F4